MNVADFILRFITGTVMAQKILASTAIGALKTIEVAKSNVRTRQSTSPMPALISLMKPAELRDLVEYLSTQGPKTTTPHP